MSSVDPCLQNLKKMVFDRLELAAVVRRSGPAPTWQALPLRALLNKEKHPNFWGDLLQTSGEYPNMHVGWVGALVEGQKRPPQQPAAVGLPASSGGRATPELRARGRGGSKIQPNHAAHTH